MDDPRFFTVQICDQHDLRGTQPCPFCRIAELEGLLHRWLTAPYGDLRDETIEALRGEGEDGE